MMELLKNLTVHPQMQLGGPTSSDLLSQVLAQIRLTGDHVYSRTLARKECLELQAEAGHVCVVTEGALNNKGAPGTPPVIDTGDLVLLPRGAGDMKAFFGHSPRVARG